MFIGAHTFAELGPAWTDRFISARRVRVSFLSPQEVRPLLTHPIPDFEMTYVSGALETLLHCTRGQPFLTQAVAFELVEEATDLPGGASAAFVGLFAGALTFTLGDAGTHTFPAGFILRTAGSQIVTVTDTANATVTGSRGVTVELTNLTRGTPAGTGSS